MAVPAETPVTRPDPALTVAIDVVLLVHAMPPVVGSDNVEPDPAHMVITPVIGAGSAFTVIDLTA